MYISNGKKAKKEQASTIDATSAADTEEQKY